MLSEAELKALERDLMVHCYKVFPDQIVGTPRAYHILADGRPLAYSVFRWKHEDPAVVLQRLMDTIHDLKLKYPTGALYWRRLPEFTEEDDFEACKHWVYGYMRLAIDHPDWKNNG